MPLSDSYLSLATGLFAAYSQDFMDRLTSIWPVCGSRLTSIYGLSLDPCFNTPTICRIKRRTQIS